MVLEQRSGDSVLDRHYPQERGIGFHALEKLMEGVAFHGLNLQSCLAEIGVGRRIMKTAANPLYNHT